MRSIDRKSLAVKILGPKNEQGFYMEKNLSLHCVNPIEQVKEEAFEFLRKKLVGKKIDFLTYVLPDKKVAADIFLDKKLISYDFIEEGFGKPLSFGEQTTQYFDGLQDAFKIAKENGNGFFNSQPQKRKKLPQIEDFEG